MADLTDEKRINTDGAAEYPGAKDRTAEEV